MAMNIPASSDPVWEEIVTGEVEYNFDYFATKVLQVSLARTLRKDPSPANLRKCCETLRKLFVLNSDQPLVQNDIKKITTKEI